MSANDIDIDELLARDVKPWWPHKPEGKDQPTQITGTVVKTDRWSSDYSTGGSVMAPVIELNPDGDSETLWRIVGSGAVLNKELRTVHVGDRIGIRYLGTVKNRTAGREDYPGFRVVVIPATEPEPQPELDGPAAPGEEPF